MVYVGGRVGARRGAGVGGEVCKRRGIKVSSEGVKGDERSVRVWGQGGERIISILFLLE